MKKERCIVTAVNEKYVPYLAVMLVSVIQSADEYYKYEIVIMHENISCESQDTIHTMNSRDNINIRFIDVSHYVQGYVFFTGSKNNSQYLSKETYFRLLTPELLPEYENVLYLDCDIIVKNGWTDIFTNDIKDHFVAAVADIWGNWECYNKHSELYKYRNTELELDNPLLYFNAGVLLMNIEKIRTRHSSKELIELATSKEWKKHDQDLLNCLCKEKVLFLDYTWNLIECPSRNALRCTPKYEIEKYNKCLKQPKIIHYASQKPWIISGCFFEQDFWKLAISTPFFEVLFSKYISEQLSQGKYLEENVYSSIKQGKIGVRFIIKCIKHYLKRVIGYS